MNIHESAEDYLETIMILQEQKGYARSVDIAAMLSVTKPSVSVAMKRLRENGYITMDKDGLITLTDTGLSIAQNMYTRHKQLTQFLLALGVSEETAREDACKIEHDISNETFEKLKDDITVFSHKLHCKCLPAQIPHLIQMFNFKLYYPFQSRLFNCNNSTVLQMFA